LPEHKSLAAALLAFHKNPPHIALDSTNPFHKSKYASLQKNNPKIREALVSEGLVYSQPLAHIGTQPALTTILMHPSSGESIESTTPLLLGMKWEKDKESGNKELVDATDPQSHGSAITYARRYALLSILGLVGDEDDDANAATPNQLRVNGKAASEPGANPPPPARPPTDDVEFAPELPVAEAQESFATPGDGITDKQLKFLKMLAEKLIKAEKLTVEEFRASLDAKYGITSTKGLTKDQAKEEITYLKAAAISAGLIEDRGE
jgi:hypothetical protein